MMWTEMLQSGKQLLRHIYKKEALTMKKLYALLALLLAFTLLLGACAKPAQDDASDASDAPGDDVQQTQPDDTLEQPDAPDAP